MLNAHGLTFSNYIPSYSIGHSHSFFLIDVVCLCLCVCVSMRVCVCAQKILPDISQFSWIIRSSLFILRIDRFFLVLFFVSCIRLYIINKISIKIEITFYNFF